MLNKILIVLCLLVSPLTLSTESFAEDALDDMAKDYRELVSRPEYRALELRRKTLMSMATEKQTGAQTNHPMSSAAQALQGELAGINADIQEILGSLHELELPLHQRFMKWLEKDDSSINLDFLFKTIEEEKGERKEFLMTMALDLIDYYNTIHHSSEMIIFGKLVNARALDIEMQAVLPLKRQYPSFYLEYSKLDEEASRENPGQPEGNASNAEKKAPTTFIDFIKERDKAIDPDRRKLIDQMNAMTAKMAKETK